jgi:hypothetical protein
MGNVKFGILYNTTKQMGKNKRLKLAPVYNSFHEFPMSLFGCFASLRGWIFRCSAACYACKIRSASSGISLKNWQYQRLSGTHRGISSIKLKQALYFWGCYRLAHCNGGFDQYRAINRPCPMDTDFSPLFNRRSSKGWRDNYGGSC